jgi:hypothetical protein
MQRFTGLIPACLGMHETNKTVDGVLLDCDALWSCRWQFDLSGKTVPSCKMFALTYEPARYPNQEERSDNSTAARTSNIRYRNKNIKFPHTTAIEPITLQQEEDTHSSTCNIHFLTLWLHNSWDATNDCVAFFHARLRSNDTTDSAADEVSPNKENP